MLLEQRFSPLAVLGFGALVLLIFEFVIEEAVLGEKDPDADVNVKALHQPFSGLTPPSSKIRSILVSRAYGRYSAFRLCARHVRS
eukprot:COSAG06_NODE_26816_length_606_cov_84.341223_1_plen_84_part_01